VKTSAEAVTSLLPYKTQSLDDASVLAETVTLLEAVLSFACQHQQVRAPYSVYVIATSFSFLVNYTIIIA